MVDMARQPGDSPPKKCSAASRVPVPSRSGSLTEPDPRGAGAYARTQTCNETRNETTRHKILFHQHVATCDIPCGVDRPGTTYVALLRTHRSPSRFVTPYALRSMLLFGPVLREPCGLRAGGWVSAGWDREITED